MIEKRPAELGLQHLFAICVLLITVISAGLEHISSPKAHSGEAGASAFSANRAMAHIRAIARDPHATGTAANDAVRNHLINELQALGFRPEVQSGFSVGPSFKSAGIVNNIVVLVPGRKRGPALMLAAHYDSAPSSPGAADDGASVAAILETLRAIKAGPQLDNDLICLLTDGEEAGLLGAELFVAKSPLAKSVGTVLNFEYRGTGGPIWMFETSRGNSELIDWWAHTLPSALGNSLLYEVYKYMPNGTDLSVFKRAGIPGLNFAAIQGHTRYHTALDRPEMLDQGTLQQQGDMMLALARSFGQRAPRGNSASNRIYFDVPGIGIVSYRAQWAPVLLVITTILFGALLLTARRKGIVRVKGLAISIAAFVLTVAALAGVSQAIWALLMKAHPGYRLILQGDTYNSAWYLPAFLSLTLALFLAVVSWLKRWSTAFELTAGAMACWLILLAVSTFLVPGTSFLLAWPLLAAVLALLLQILPYPTPRSANAQTGILLFGALPAIMIMTPILSLLYSALTVSMIAVTIVFAVLLFGLISPMLLALSARLRLPLLAVITGIACLGGATLNAGFDAKHPRPYSLFYATAGDSGKSLWLSSEPKLDDWMHPYFGNAPERRNVPEWFGEGSERLWTTAAPARGLPQPSISVLSDRSVGDTRVLALQVRSERSAPRMLVSVDGTPVLTSRIEDAVYSEKTESHWRTRLVGFGSKPVHIELSVRSKASFRVRVNDISYDFGTLIGASPVDALPQPFGQSATIQVVHSVAFAPLP